MTDIFGPLVIGFFGSLHCLGMCGPLVLAYSLHVKGANGAAGVAAFHEGLLGHAAFHAGRVATYALLGAMAAGLVGFFDPARYFPGLRGGVSFILGGFMVLMGLVLLRVIPMPRAVSAVCGAPWARIEGRAPGLLSAGGAGPRVLLGAATGFLPCGLSWAMIAKAAASGNAASGLLTMALFGLGTVPALFALGAFATVVPVRLRAWGDRIAALSVIVMGAILLFKGGRALG